MHVKSVDLYDQLRKCLFPNFIPDGGSKLI